ncbi:hypothetical protein J1C67_07110 [Clostridium gasigenes]|uniref:glycan biosynthesis hexose transferase WsfD n=1 Tax=Clostridium gasigenes TaxID=94869 RepID=UPI0014385847|nr:hypothetical protein [Clostridium gasigenes]NKF08795.1 hypothetical protein [Clostridium gasigenes]QSW20867.1 hypothetical protein J1C67_07110 [Clostridium gasigenes]
MRLKKRNLFYQRILFLILALIIIKYVLFSYPQPGVADQGDFQRVMSEGGIGLINEDIINLDFKRFNEYTVTDYSIKDNGFIKFESSTIGYIIYFISLICRSIGEDVFKTQYLAVIYVIIYVSALYIIMKSMNIKSRLKFGILSLLSLFVFLDGNYLIWFNSLYGEPMMISTLMLFIAAYSSYVYKKYTLKDDNKIIGRIVFIFIAAFLFVGSKMQIITAVPMIIFMLVKVLLDNRRVISKVNLVCLSVFLVIILIYPMRITMKNKEMSKDTQYNSVFYGVLNGSNDPKQDLIDLGLNSDMYVEAGKHAYLNPDEYVKYAPKTEITENEFYRKMSNGKLAKFYLTHPIRLIEGMKYTANHAFITGTGLGKYSRSYSEESIREFDKFTIWSKFRENKFPKNIRFVILIYTMIFSVSIYKYVKNKGNNEIRNKIYIIWLLIFIAALQFPMPFVGNGEADTTKQLFLFNFITDVIILISVYWSISKGIDFIGCKYKSIKSV